MVQLLDLQSLSIPRMFNFFLFVFKLNFVYYQEVPDRKIDIEQLVDLCFEEEFRSKVNQILRTLLKAIMVDIRNIS